MRSRAFLKKKADSTGLKKADSIFRKILKKYHKIRFIFSKSLKKICDKNNQRKKNKKSRFIFFKNKKTILKNDKNSHQIQIQIFKKVQKKADSKKQIQGIIFLT